jgi:hypothetical protein
MIKSQQHEHLNILDMTNPMNQRDAVMYCIGIIGNEVARAEYSPISKEYGQYAIDRLRQLKFTGVDQNE